MSPCLVPVWRLPKSVEKRSFVRVLGAACLGALFAPQPLLACAACYGQSDSPMSAGMNWGILSLLGMIVFVLGGVAGFFVFLARRAVKAAALNGGGALSAEADTKESTPGFVPLDSPPLSGRAGLGGVSMLARRRPHCAQAAQRSRS